MNREKDFDRVIRDGARALAPSGNCIEDDRLAAFYQDALTQADADAVRAHLATCPDCLEAARDARRFVEAMGDTRPARSREASPIRRFAIAAALAGIGLIAGSFYLTGRSGRLPSPEGQTAGETWSAIVVTPAPYGAGPDELVWRGERPAEDASPLDTAAARYRAGDVPAAAEDLAAYVAAHPDDARGRFYLGVARLLSGKPLLAASELEAALAMPGSPSDTSWYLALACLRSGRLSRGRVELEQIAASEGPHRDEARALLRRLDGEEPR